MNILHAHTDPPLLERLQEMLAGSARADIAVGYFFISGFGPLAESLSHEGMERVRILVGHVDRPVLEQVASGLQQAEALRLRQEQDGLVRRSAREEGVRQAADGVGVGVSLLPQSEESEQAIAKLRDLVVSGRVEVRSYPRGPLHAKAYLCWYANNPEPGSAVVGSSNLTLAGFTHNTELNVRVTGDAEMHELGRWFDELWVDSDDIGKELVVQLDRSWALAASTPYEVYLKALHELYGGQIGEELPLDQGRATELANFQLDAVKQALNMVASYGGCYVGDVVGLGKTYIGAETLRQLKVTYPNDGPPLIICPPGLIPMWRFFNERFGLGAEVISHAVISAPPDPEFDEESGRYLDEGGAGAGVVLQDKYPNRGPVLVDEAHNFRNVNRRSRGLRHYFESGNHKVVLLSATPQNLGPQDIYRQISLFLDDEDHGIDIEPVNLPDYFRNAQRWFQYRTEEENYKADYAAWEAGGRTGAAPMNKPVEPDVPPASIEEVLSPVFIRRRRKDITELYGDSAEVNGKPVQFPDPKLDNLTYQLDKVYARAGSLVEIQALIRSHEGARYRAAHYLTKEAAKNPEYRDLSRASDRIAGLMRVLLLKRLESSIEAFRSTLRNLIQSNRNFAQALVGGYVPIGQTATRILNGEAFDSDSLLAVLEAEEQRKREHGARRDTLVHSTHDFRVDEWQRDLDADHAVLQDLLGRMENVGPDDDDKLRALRDFLDRKEVRSGKVLIFSEAETTIEYLYRQLDPKDDIPEIERLTGSNRDQASAIVRRFSPHSNPSNTRIASETRVLLATDVVSEGQNLQDCARVLNYDLHWNPVRLIQRFGRVDRIGTEHDVINLHNMWPDTAVDAGLELTDRLHNRVQSFHDLIGLDSKLLSEAERLNNEAMYRIYAEKEMPEATDGLDSVAASQRAVALLQRIRESEPDKWDWLTTLPDGIRSALVARGPRPTVPREEQSDDNTSYVQAPMAVEGAQMPLVSPSTPSDEPSAFDDPRPGETLVLLAAGDVKACYAVGSNLVPRPIGTAQFTAAAECEPDTPTQLLPEDTNERVMAAFAAFREGIARRLGTSRRPRGNRSRQYVSRQLRIARGAEENPATAQRINDLRLIFQGSLPEQAERALADLSTHRIEGQALLERLNALRERYRLNPPERQDADSAGQPQVVRIVCSDGLV